MKNRIYYLIAAFALACWFDGKGFSGLGRPARLGEGVSVRLLPGQSAERGQGYET